MCSGLGEFVFCSLFLLTCRRANVFKTVILQVERRISGNPDADIAAMELEVWRELASLCRRYYQEAAAPMQLFHVPYDDVLSGDVLNDDAVDMMAAVGVLSRDMVQMAVAPIRMDIGSSLRDTIEHLMRAGSIVMEAVRVFCSFFSLHHSRDGSSSSWRICLGGLAAVLEQSPYGNLLREYASWFSFVVLQ